MLSYFCRREITETFADKLKRMRDEKSLSQQELAQRIFVSRSAVAKWEQGRGFPSVASLRYIAAVFGVTIDELVSDKEIAILEIEKDKKLSVRTKLLIAMSAILAAIIITGAIFLGMFYPRRLSGYIDLESNDIDEVFLKYATEDEEKIVLLAVNKTEIFFYYVKNMKIIPSYSAYKCETTYSFVFIGKNKKYELSRMGLSIRENERKVKSVDFQLYSGDTKYLLVLFGLTFDEMEDIHA